MDHIFILAETISAAHYYADHLGFKRGQYRAVGSVDHIRGMRRCTMFVVPRADMHPDYTRISHQAMYSDFTVIFIDEETLDIIDGIAYTEAEL